MKVSLNVCRGCAPFWGQTMQNTKVQILIIKTNNNNNNKVYYLNNRFHRCQGPHHALQHHL